MSATNVKLMCKACGSTEVNFVTVREGHVGEYLTQWDEWQCNGCGRTGTRNYVLLSLFPSDEEFEQPPYPTDE